MSRTVQRCDVGRVVHGSRPGRNVENEENLEAHFNAILFYFSGEF